jgi:HD-GYP domain-containing protein (c-di-GMP phosphodiesterase class II)
MKNLFIQWMARPPAMSHQRVKLEYASRPLQVIIAFSAIVLVISFAHEILYFFYEYTPHLLLTLSLGLSLNVWALIETFQMSKNQEGFALFRNLFISLLLQGCLICLRIGSIILGGHDTTSAWFQSNNSIDYSQVFFLVFSALIFLLIHKFVVGVYTNNERLKAENTEKQMLSTLNAMAMARDNETGNHILRTQNYVSLLAKRLKLMRYETDILTDSFIKLLYLAAPLHDVGKVGIPDAILNKNTSLTAEEWVVMKTHTTIGESILASASSENGKADDIIEMAIMIAGGHHEKWDGSGYPRGLRGQDIPLAARLMSLADMYDALVSERVYKESWSHESACKEIMNLSGTHFDPNLVHAFVLEQEAFYKIALKYND